MTVKNGPGGAVLALACAFLLAGCGSDPVANDGRFSVDDLYGSWSWVSSQGGIAGETRTPESEGFEQTIVIEEPNLISLFRDGEVAASTTFIFIAPDREDGEELATLLLDEPLMSFESEFVGVDIEGNLVLADPCCDGFVHTFSPVG